MGNDHIRRTGHSQAHREQSQAQGKSPDERRYCSDQDESWHWNYFDSYSEELQQIITLITSGHEPGKAIKEEHHADK